MSGVLYPIDDGASAAESRPSTSAPAQPMSRRRVVRLVLGFSIVSTLTMIVTPIVGFLAPATRSSAQPSRVMAATLDGIPAGKGKVVALGSKPIIVCNAPSGLKAFSAVCTHLGCIVAYDEDRSPDIVSPCHDGHFSVRNGTVISGPPPAPLKEYPVAVEKDQIYVQDA